MKKGIQKMLACILTITCLTGCTKKELPDSYVAGSDFQYMHMLEESGVSFWQNGKDGKFFLAGGYIYFMDKDKNIVPLCNKADCLHNRETDETKKKNCNAYTGLFQYDGQQKIVYQDGYVYFMSLDTSTEQSDFRGYILQRTKEDGSEKESLKEWKKCNINDWIIHRGVCYYVEQVYVTDETKNEVEDRFSVKSFALKYPEKEKTVYKPKKEWYVLTAQWLQAYGNYVYFGLAAYDRKVIHMVNEKNNKDYLMMPEWSYQINTGELNEITIPELKKGIDTGYFVMWKDCLLISPYDQQEEENAKNDIYITDLDGAKPQKVMKGIEQSTKFFSDGKYLYMTNIINVEKGIEKTCRVQVLDDKYKEIDSFVLPQKVNLEWSFEIGSSDEFTFFVISDDKKSMEIQICDKGKIGSLHGKELPLETVATLPMTEEDIEYIEGE